VFKKYSQMKLQMKARDLAKAQLQANEQGQSYDTVRPKEAGTGMARNLEVV
jgi:hypothetical protein